MWNIWQLLLLSNTCKKFPKSKDSVNTNSNCRCSIAFATGRTTLALLYKVNSFLIFTAASQLYFPLHLWLWASFMRSQEWSSLYINRLGNWAPNVQKRHLFFHFPFCLFVCFWMGFKLRLYLDLFIWMWGRSATWATIFLDFLKKKTRKKNHPAILQRAKN